MNKHLKRKGEIPELEKIFKKEKNMRMKSRIHAVILAHQGYSNYEISKILLVHPSSVKYWIERWNKGGVENLKDKVACGRPSKFSKDEIEELKKDLKLSPKNFGFFQEAWDTKIILIHIKNKFKKTYHEKSIYKFLRKLGFDLKVPRGRHYKKDKEKEKEYKEKIKEVRDNVTFIDEKVVNIRSLVKKAWFLKGERASVKINWIPTGKIVIYGALNRLGKFIWKVYDKMKWENTKDFVKGIKGMIIGDGAPWHRGLFSRRNFLRLPPYSPEMNPVEEIWRILKLRISNVFVSSKEELERIVTEALRDIKFNISIDKFL